MSLNATYSPEDNKLRIYPSGCRVDSLLDADEYSAFKRAGYKWAGKQECFVAPSWNPTAEDWALELCGEIDDEDYSPEERAADRAERFSGYRDNRRNEAGGLADTFEAGPTAFGHQSRGRAERAANRHDRYRTKAVSQWSKAEYWQGRTAGVIHHALHKSSAAVRRSRILRLEAEQRKHEKNRAEYATKFARWSAVLTMERCDETTAGDGETLGPAVKQAYGLANGLYGHCWGEYKHPRSEREASLYSLMTDPTDPITAREAATLWLADATDPSDTTSGPARWSAHYELRLSYERAMLANEGGTAADADMEPGGWIGQRQIQAVNKSPVTGRVVSVKILAPERWYRGEGEAPLTLQTFNVERLKESAYRAPTDAERAEFAQTTKDRKAKAKASKPKAPPLVNPTDADAERLQAILNAVGEAKHKQQYSMSDYKPTAVLRMTQADYSEKSKGAYAHYETRTLHQCGKISRASSNMYTTEGTAYDKSLAAVACKLRIRSSSGWHSPPHVVVLTDKPQNPLPLDWEAIESKNETFTLSN